MRGVDTELDTKILICSNTKLRDMFYATCKEYGVVPSKVLRRAMVDYILDRHPDAPIDKTVLNLE